MQKARARRDSQSTPFHPVTPPAATPPGAAASPSADAESPGSFAESPALLSQAEAEARAQGEATRPHAQLDHEQILDATLGCLQAVGYDRTTIRAIATRLGCAVGSIYRYFTDKRTLLDAVCQRRFEAVAQEAALGTDPAWVCGRYAEVASEQPELYRLMFWLSSVSRSAEEHALPGVVRRTVEGLAHQVGDAAAQDRWSRLHGAVMLGLPLEQVLERANGSRDGAVPVPPRVDQPPAMRSQRHEEAEAAQVEPGVEVEDEPLLVSAREDVTLL